MANFIEAKFVSSLLPKRDDNSNKGSFGKILNIAGSKMYSGAAFLSSKSALKVGAGFVSLASMIIEYDTTSGSFNSSFDVTSQNGKYIVKDGKNEVNVDTTSGNLTLDLVLSLN